VSQVLQLYFPVLNTHLTRSIPDLEGLPNTKGERPLYSDGCGLMALRFAQQLARAKKIVFNGQRYTPSVVQIRYRGYKVSRLLHSNTTELDFLREF